MLVFETHATSLDNEAGLASGWFDVDLSARGEEQALGLGERHRGRSIARVYTSDLRRAWRTAEIAFGDRELVARDVRLRECDYGELTRLPTSIVEAARLEHIHTPFPGGESYNDCVARVSSFLLEVAAARVPGSCLIIGHRAAWYALEHLLGGRPLRDAIADPWSWQPGWQYAWPAARGSRGSSPGP